jgi:uncharacterized surface protein with fasciclin (FAS1) repeats
MKRRVCGTLVPETHKADLPTSGRRTGKQLRRMQVAGLGALLFICLVQMTSCSENIDDSNMYTFKGETMTDHFVNNPDQFSNFLALLDRVKPGKNSSSMRGLLSARGNYTCFAPTNEAVQAYVDSLHTVGIMQSSSIADIPDSIARDMVFNCLIDNGKTKAYPSTSFEEGVLAQNMNDRPITITFDTLQGGASTIIVNTKSHIVEKDIKVENGYIHAVDHVIAPSNDMLGGLVENTPNTKIFGILLSYTGLDDSMMLYRDEYYEERLEKLYPDHLLEGFGKMPIPEHKYYGYTCFVEPDDVFSTYGVTYDETNPTNTIEQLKKVLIDKGVYKDADKGTNYKNPQNIIYQFVAYHLLKERVPYNRLAIHYNEYGYNNGAYTINTWEYYETLGPWRRLMKVTSGPKTGGYRINRYSKLSLNTYKETSVMREGIHISADNGKYENNALNGFYYPISDLMMYDDDVPDKVLNERLRFDFASLFKEMMTMNLRRPVAGASANHNWNFPDCFFDDVKFKDVRDGGTTAFMYLPGTNSGWRNYQGDEFNIIQHYDFTLKLPPVPYAGVYEIRYACNNYSNVRGMAQFYMGTNPNNLAAVGVPIDLRIRASDSFVGYVADTGDGETDSENDKLMRNNGYMKAPLYFTPTVGGNSSARADPSVFRKIIYRGYMEPQKTYYMRFKSVLEATYLQFVLDYIELCPKSIYDGVDGEDRW